LLFINLVLNFPLVQTALTHTLANYYSNKLHVKIHIGKVDFQFLKKLVLRDVYIQDLHADTLLYATDLKFDIGQLSFKSHQIFLSEIDIDKATIHLTTYKKEHSLNLQFIIDAFASKDTTKTVVPGWKVAFGKLALNNVNFRLQNQHDTSTPDNYGINTSDLKVHEIYSKIQMIQFTGDTVRATIESLSAKEQSGFILKKFSCFVKLSAHGMELNALKIQTPTTNILTDLIFKYKKFGDFDDFTNQVDMNAKFNKSKVCFEDISYFAHGLKAVHNCFTLSGEYSGTVNHLRGHNMSIGWDKFSNMEGDFQLDDITDIDSAYIKVYLTNLITSKQEIEDLPAPPFDREGHIKLPDNISTLHTLHLSGFFDGSITSFKAGGTILTDIGNISASLHLWQKPGDKQENYTGLLETKNFNLGEFWQVKDLGTITSTVSIKGKGLKKENADATLSGIIENITYRKYTYQNTIISGELKKGFFSGFAKITDPHIHLDFNGKINLASQNSIFQFESHINQANLSALHILKDTSTAILSTHIKVNATGSTLDNLEGAVYIDSTSYITEKNMYYVNHLALASSLNGDYHIIDLKSDYADATLSGHFNLTNTYECLQNLMASYIPSIFPKEKPIKGGKKDKHDYSLILRFNENTGLTNLFVPGLVIASGTKITGHYNEYSNDFNLNINSSEIDLSSKKLKNWKIDATGDESSMVFNSGCDTLYVSDSLYAANFTLNGNATNDTVHYALVWNDDSANFANIPGYVNFPTKSKIVFKFLHPVISMVDSVWRINNNNLIVYDSARWSVKSFIISHSNQSFISLQGIVANNNTDKLNLTIHDLNLASLNLGSSQLAGKLNGTASISNLLGHPFFTSSLSFSDLALNKEYLGDGTLNSRWDTSSQSIILEGNSLYYGNPALSINGKYTPGKSDNNLNLDVSLTKFPTKLFQRYLSDVSSVLNGNVTGQAHITGTPSHPLINGDVTAVLKQMKFDYLNISCHSPAINIKITPDTFKILPSTLLDEDGNKALFTGTFTHQNFKNLQMDFFLDAKNFLCLNTNELQNNSYFGKAYVTGNMEIYGPLDALHIDANITTEKNTVFTIPLENASELDQANYIEFTSKGKGKKLHTAPAYKVTLGGLQLDFTVHVTSDATAKILFSSKEERLESQGLGTIQFSLDNIGDINMRGNYTITGGDYIFILGQNIINKRFILQPGGTISWNGDPYNADINLTTTYSTSASLEPFFQGDVSGAYTKRFPVDCDLDLSGKLTSPDVSFKINLPTVDDQTRQIVESYLSNEDMLKTQVFTLLIINSFAPVGAGITNTSGAQAGLATSTEMLSNQLSNWINKINNGVNVAVDYQPGTQLSPSEARLALSKELLNGKLVVTGDAVNMSGIPTASTQTTNANSNLIEFDAEYKLSKNGKLKIKAYNKANDNTQIYALSPYTQGAGISYKEGFSTFHELWHKIFGKKPETPKVRDSNSK